MAFWTCQVCGCGVEASSPYLVRAMGWTIDHRAVRDVGPAVCPRCERTPMAPLLAPEPADPEPDPAPLVLRATPRA